MTLLRTTPNQDSSFEDQTADRLRRLKGTLAALFAAAPGEIRRPVDIQKVLGLPHTLSWQIHQVATSTDPLAVVKHVPKAKAMSTVLAAASERRVPGHLIEAVADAFGDFESFVAESAGDRSGFESIVNGTSSGGEKEALDAQHRRAAFRANCHIWGLQVRTRLSCAILHPAADPAYVDAVQIHGDVGMRRNRRDATCVVSKARATDATGKVLESTSIEPVDLKTYAVCKAPLLGDFSSDALPLLACVPSEDGYQETILLDDAVGKASAVTYFLAEVSRNASTRVKSDTSRLIQARAGVRKPAETLIHDVLVYEGTFGSITPEAYVRGDLMQRIETDESQTQHQRLPQHVSVAYLGKGPAMLNTPDVPRYPEMAEYAFNKLGWDGDRFDVFRCRVEYPVMPSTVVVKFPLPA